MKRMIEALSPGFIFDVSYDSAYFNRLLSNN